MRTTIRNNGTKTSAFGSPGRINHDATTFYESRLYEGLRVIETKDFTENPIPENHLNRIFIKSSERMEELPDNSVHLMVTSPPYNVGKEYDDNLTLKEYRELIKNIWKEVYRVLVPGGRACVNIANLGRKPYLPLHSYIIDDMLEMGYLMRGEIIWNKANSGSPSTAWGSWLSAKNPILRDIHEYILIFSKGSYGREQNKFLKSTINKEEFLELTKSVWTFSAESARKIGHPAPFPLELPYRLIQLYTFENDIVLDPFMGSGQTAIAAVKTKRNYIGYDISKEYVKLAEKRIKDFVTITTTPTLFDPPQKYKTAKKRKSNKNKFSTTTIFEEEVLNHNLTHSLKKSENKIKSTSKKTF
ncbi:MAG: site-specific DNA-methyltransferase [Ignavibacteriales bacterium]|nr:site-specific DNA-methyltransferase [Ignavibacteriales bacterium]